MTSYTYIFVLAKELTLRIGGLGIVRLNEGVYAYVGSAKVKRPFTRVLRHYLTRKKLKWHIDYITTSEYVKSIISILCYDLSEDSMYRLVRTLAVPAIKGFGATDVRDHITHLFRIHDYHRFILNIIKYLLNRCKYLEFVVP